MTVMSLGTLNSQLGICTNSGALASSTRSTDNGGHYNLHLVFNYSTNRIHRCIIRIFLVFMIALLSLFLQSQ